MATSRKRESRLSDEDTAKVMALIKDSDSVELKLTVPETAHSSTVAALKMDPLDAQIRQVFFFDTPDLTLYEQGVRRPPRAEEARRLRRQAPPSRPVAAPERCPPAGRVRGRGGCDAGRLCLLGFAQGDTEGGRSRDGHGRGSDTEALFEGSAGVLRGSRSGAAFDDLSVLGPIFVLKLKFAPTEFDRKLVGCWALS